MGNPVNVLHGIASFSVDAANVGFTEGGVEAEKSVDTFDKLVDQELDALDMMPTQWTLVVRTSFAEVTLNNLYTAWNEVNGPQVGVPGAGFTTQDIGLQQTIPEHELIFVGKAPGGRPRTYTLWRGKQIGSSAHGLQKGDKIVFPVEFRCLPDFAKNKDQYYGKIVDTTA